MKVLRLIENLVAGAGAVGYLIESMHGAGPPMAQRIMIGRQADLAGKIRRGEFAGSEAWTLNNFLGLPSPIQMKPHPQAGLSEGRVLYPPAWATGRDGTLPLQRATAFGFRTYYIFALNYEPSL